jgi:hypothetical protein
MQADGYVILRNVVPPPLLSSLATSLASDDADFAHSPAQWSLRCLWELRSAFAAAWEEGGDEAKSVPVDSLLCSFDGGVCQREGAPGMGWHVDQTERSDGVASIQCVVAVSDSDARTGSLRVCPGSHLLHSSLMDSLRVPTSRREDEWQSSAVPPSHVRSVCRRTGRPSVLVSLCAGDAVLFDARTVHRVDRSRDRRRERLVSYVSYAPRRLASATVIARRRRAFVTRTQLTHWPDRYVPVRGPSEGGRRRSLRNEADVVRGLVG